MDTIFIAVVNGHAAGGGCELAMACDLCVSLDQTLFSLPEIKLGILPGSGGTQRLTRLVGAGRALGLMFLGEFILAPKALR